MAKRHEGIGNNGDAYGKAARKYRAPAPARPFRYKVTGGKAAVATYELAHQAWTVGAIDDFYYGTRSDADATVIWKVDGVDMGGANHAAVADLLRVRLAEAGVRSISWGPTWCGYRGLVVVFASGLEVTQHFDGTAVVESTRQLESAEAVA